MTQNRSEDINQRLHDLRIFLDHHSNDEIQNAITAEDFSKLAHLPVSARQTIENRRDLWDDIWWYTEIRNECDLADFPCVHIAYAMSARANCAISRSHGVFSIRIDEATAEGIVIGYCPWCAKPLNVDGGA